MKPWSLNCPPDVFHFYFTVWGVGPDVTSWQPGPGLEAQVNVVCHKTKLMRAVLKEERNVPLLVIWLKQRKVLPPDDAVKGAVKQKACMRP